MVTTAANNPTCQASGILVVLAAPSVPSVRWSICERISKDMPAIRHTQVAVNETGRHKTYPYASHGSSFLILEIHVDMASSLTVNSYHLFAAFLIASRTLAFFLSTLALRRAFFSRLLYLFVISAPDK
jgi:hypothetical protein